MKKILTLMAAMSACAGTATAADYVWSVDGTGKITANVMGDIAFADNQFTFTVNAGEQVWVKGAGVKVKFNGEELAGKEQTFDMEGTGLLYNPAGTGQVVVVLGDGASIEKIKVVGSKSLEIETKFKEVQDAIANANQETAKWAGTELNGFFSKVREQFNDQGAEAQAVRALLENCQKDNTVDANADALIDRLDAAKNKIGEMLALAKDNYSTYLDIIGDDAANLKEQLKKGEAKPSSLEVNRVLNTTVNSLEYIKNWAFENNQIKDKGYRTSWVKEEWDNFTTNGKNEPSIQSIQSIKDSAIVEMEKFPNSFGEGYERDDFKAKYDKLQQEAKNVVARANFERDNKDKINKLNEQMAKIEQIAATKDAPFELPERPEDYDFYKQVVSELAVFVNADNDRRKVKDTDLNSLIANQYNPAKAAFDQVEVNFRAQAVTALEALYGKTQTELDDKANKISAKYEHEPETQKDYEQKFALIQKDLDAIKAKVHENSTFNDVVKGYQDCVTAIAGVDKSISNLWGTTLSAQKQEVLRLNRVKAEALLASIDSVRNTYSDNVLRINAWIEKDWTNNDTDVKLRANLKELFSVAGGVDKMRDSVLADTVRYYGLISNTPDIEFNANDNQYRLLKGNVEDFTNKITAVKTAILAQITEAVFTANKAAAVYLNGTPRSDAYWFVTDAQQDGYKDANLWAGTKHEYMSANAVALFKKEYEKIAFKDLTEQNPALQGAGYISEADNIIREGYVDNLANVDIAKQRLADQVDSVVAILGKVEPAVKALTEGALKDYKALYDSIYVQKIDWNVVKAETDKWQKGVGDAFNVTERLKELNLLFDGKKGVDATEDGAYTMLEKDNNPVNANDADLKDAIKAKIEKFKAGLYEIRHYPEIQANNALLATAQNDIKAVEAKLTNAYQAVKEYDETIQTGANELLNAAKVSLANAKTAIEDACKDLTLVDNYTKGKNLRGALDNVAQEIADALAWAAEQAKGADLDYNGDGEVNVKDLVDADAAFQESGDGATFYKFLDAYLEYLGK